MEDRYLINFKLFCQRTGFNLKEYIKKNQSCSYVDLCDTLRKKNIEPVSLEFFNEIKTHVTQENKSLEKKEIVKKSAEQLPKKRKRRRSKKND
jgi:hypothetical protein